MSSGHGRSQAATLRRSLLIPFVFATLLSSPVPAASQVPAPEDIWGFKPGTDYKLADYEQIHEYLSRLDAASDRVRLEVIGQTTLGRPMLLAIISSEGNIRNLAHYKEISRRLALAKGVTDEDARRLAGEGKAVVWIDGGLHSTEVAHAQHTSELAYWLATSESDEARRIRENVIMLVMPVMNPDGQQIVVEWYRRNVGTPFETAPLPVLYHHYAGHDNNRDFFMFTQVETRAIGRQIWHDWFPQILLNHHQSSPFPGRIWVPPLTDPVSTYLDPLAVIGLSHIGAYMMQRFSEESKPGVNTGIIFDMWHNGGTRGAAGLHNMLGLFTETALYEYATPHCYDPDEIPETFGARADHLPARRPSIRYPDPWLGGCWHLRDAMDYMMTASRAVADLAAKLKEEYLYNIYLMGKRQIERGKRSEEGPFAYIIDLGAQRDVGTAVEMLRTLRFANIEIWRADESFGTGGREYPAGVYVIPPQAFRPYVLDLMEAKDYPGRRYPGGPLNTPYDFTGYELPPQMGVEVARVEETFSFNGREMEEIPLPPGAVHGEDGDSYLLSPVPNASAVALNRLLAGGARVAWASETFDAAGERWPSGTAVIRNASRAVVEGLARDLGLDFYALDGGLAVTASELHAPRIGIYQSYMAPLPEGWTRWLLDKYEFPFERLTDEDIRGGDLSRFDIIILPSQEAGEILRGHAPGTMPAEYVGGLGAEGAAILKRYVDNGGWLLVFNESVEFAVTQFGLPLRNVAAGAGREEFSIPGSLIRIRVDSADPLAYGMAEEAVAFLWRTDYVLDLIPAAGAAEQKVEIYARYAQEDFLVSGFQLGGERYLAGRPAAIRVPLGQGQVILIGFSPHFRGQPHNTFKLMFNPLFASTLQESPRVSAATR